MLGEQFENYRYGRNGIGVKVRQTGFGLTKSGLKFGSAFKVM